MSTSDVKNILITGATAGIGKHAALALARDGHRVFATGRREEALAVLRLEAQGTRLETVQLDVTDQRSIDAARDEIDRRTGGYGVDALVNNAGYGLMGPLEIITDEDLRAQFDTNVFGLMAVTRAFLPRMRERRSGRLVNISSVGGRVTFPMMGAYQATKYAVESLSDALRNELAPFGVHVSLVEPGAIKSEFADRAMTTLNKYNRPDSPYAAILARAEQLRARMDSTASGPEPVVDAITHAIVARRPSARYLVPLAAQVAVAFFSLVPTRLTDALLRGVMGLNKKGLTAPQPA